MPSVERVLSRLSSRRSLVFVSSSPHSGAHGTQWRSEERRHRALGGHLAQHEGRAASQTVGHREGTVRPGGGVSDSGPPRTDALMPAAGALHRKGGGVSLCHLALELAAWHRRGIEGRLDHSIAYSKFKRAPAAAAQAAGREDLGRAVRP